MRIVLTRNAAFRLFEMNADMAFAASRPELLLLCRLAAEHGNRLTPDLLMKLVPSLTSTAQALNIIGYTSDLRLLDTSGFLTPVGQRALDEQVVFLPETGVYGFWVLEDATTGGTTMLHCERLDALYTAPSVSELTPLDLNLPRATATRSCMDSGLRFEFLDLSFSYADRAEPMTRTICKHRNVDVEWLLSDDTASTQLHITAALPKSVRDAFAKPPRTQKVKAVLEGPVISFGEVAGHALSIIKDARWHSGAGVLAVRCPESERERKTFSRDVELGAVEIPDHGHFRSATVQGIPLVPESSLAARDWAARLCLDRLDDYVSPGDLEWEFEKSIARTPLAEFSCEFPGIDHLLAQVDASERSDLRTLRRWYLLAPRDVRPDLPEAEVPVLPMERDGSGDVLQSREEVSEPVLTKAVHLLPSEKPAPLEVLRRLHITADTRRVLYCDRYIDEQWHFERLRAVVDALRELAPEATVDVMTFKNRDADTAKEQKLEIEALTGNSPAWYQDVCKRKPYPHDRYLVIQRQIGETPTFWKITNGLLSFDPPVPGPLTPTTACIWRSQSFVTAPPEGIPQEIRNLAGGIA